MSIVVIAGLVAGVVLLVFGAAWLVRGALGLVRGASGLVLAAGSSPASSAQHGSLSQDAPPPGVNPRTPPELNETEIRCFLLRLIHISQVCNAAYRQVLAALKFLYTVTLDRAWEVQRIPIPRYRRRKLPQASGGRL